ncbi:glycosyltransferase family 39 protein [Sphingomonas sp.]|uniref:glycosyltransferase family 39 protein n=1 Tax=Sphingomonas sp. TaxID=28214 RepID=UPI002C7F37F8|nr:glycosyltransferase family 39 protein [Sphingomonas sp.]HWK35740.1 glycosyltransferase family 39 protein [Sphingomonas sp.]
MTAAPAPPPWFWPAVVLIAVGGGALRIAAGFGGLWLDEAWSAQFARDVATPAGVFLNIHHDNNHHLNTLWLQLVGYDAPPVVQRGLSIAAGTAAILIAALIGGRRGPAAGVVTALLFAVSPILVTYGSEARGYAPMVLALLIAIAIADRWLDRPDTPPPALAMAVTCLLGLLSQFTMAFGIAAIAGWVALRGWRERGISGGADATVRLMGPALILVSVAATLILVVLPGPGGFQFGHYQAFAVRDLHAGLSQMLAYSFGPGMSVLLLPIALGATIAALVAMPSLKPRLALYALAIVAFPLAVGLLRIGNAGIARYYLLTSVALLLLAGEVTGGALARRGAVRIGALVMLAAVLVAGGWRDAALVADRRADPDRALQVIAAARPAGATATVERARAWPVLATAAAARRYPLTQSDCGEWLFVDRDGDEPFPATPVRCDHRYRPVIAGHPTGLSGTHWRLYRRQ